MKKLLLTLVAAVFACCLSARAGTVTFDFATEAGIKATMPDAVFPEEPSKGTVVSGEDFKSGDISISANKGKSTEAQIWLTTQYTYQYRVYNGATLTIKSTGENITSVKITGPSGTFVLPTGGVGNLSDKTWTGSSATVNLDVTVNAQITAIEVTTGTGGGTTDPDPTPGGGEIQTAVFYSTTSYSGNANYETQIVNGSGGDLVDPAVEFEAGDIEIYFEKKNNSKSNVNTNIVRWYQSDILHITPSNGATITKVEFTATQGSFTSNIGTVSGNVWTGSTNQELLLTASAQVRFTVIAVTYELPAGDKEDAGLSFGETKSYTIDYGDNFTAPSLENPHGLNVNYASSNTSVATIDGSGNVSIEGPGTTIISATSAATDQYFEGNASYTITVLAVANSIEEAYKVAQDTEMRINFPMTVAFKNNNNTYATDGTNFTQIYSQAVSSTFPNYEVGDVIPQGWTATYTLYNNVTPELVPVTAPGASTQNNGFTPQEVTSVTNEMVNEVVMIKNVEITTATPSGKETFVVGDVTYYNNYGVASQQPGKYDIVGVVSIYNGNPQLNVISFKEIVEPVTVEDVSPANGTTFPVEEFEDLTITVKFTGEATVNSAQLNIIREGLVLAEPTPAYGETASEWTLTVPAWFVKKLIMDYTPDGENKLGFPVIIEATYADGDENIEIGDDGRIELYYYIETDIAPGAPFTVNVEDEVESELSSFTVSTVEGYNTITNSNALTLITITGEGYEGKATSFADGVVTFNPAITKSGSYTISFPLNAFIIGNTEGNGSDEDPDGNNTGDGTLGGDEYYQSQAMQWPFNVTVQNESEGPAGPEIVFDNPEWYPEYGVKYYYTPKTNGTIKWTYQPTDENPVLNCTNENGGMWISGGTPLMPTATDGTVTSFSWGDWLQNCLYAEYELTAGTTYYYEIPRGSNDKEYALLFTWEESADEPSVEPIPDGAYVVYNDGEVNQELHYYNWWNAKEPNYTAANPSGNGEVWEFKSDNLQSVNYKGASMGLLMEAPENTGILHEATLNFDWYANTVGAKYIIRLSGVNDYDYPFEVTAENVDKWNTVSFNIADQFPALAEEWDLNKKLGEGYVFGVVIDEGKIAQDVVMDANSAIYFNRVYYTNVDEDWEAPADNTPVPTTVPTPQQPAEDVISIFSSAYEPAITFNIGQWGQKTTVTDFDIDDQKVEKLLNFNYLGWEFSGEGVAIDVTGYDYLHVDFWTPTEGAGFSVTPVTREGTIKEKAAVQEVKVEEWNSYDIPLSYYSEAGMDLSTVFQMKFDNGIAEEIGYIANVYFWKEAQVEEPGAEAYLGISTGDDVPTLNEDYPLEATSNGSYAINYTMAAGTNFNIWVRNDKAEAAPADARRKVNAADYTVYGPAEITVLNFTKEANTLTQNIGANGNTYWTVNQNLELDIAFDPEAGTMTASTDDYITPEDAIGEVVADDVTIDLVLGAPGVEDGMTVSWMVPVKLNLFDGHQMPYNGFYFVVNLPEGFRVSNATVQNGWTVRTYENQVMVYITGDASNATDLVTLEISKKFDTLPEEGVYTYDLTIDDVIFTDPDFDDIFNVSGSKSSLIVNVTSKEIAPESLTIQAATLKTPSWNRLGNNIAANGMVAYVTAGQEIEVTYTIEPENATITTIDWNNDNVTAGSYNAETGVGTATIKTAGLTAGSVTLTPTIKVSEETTVTVTNPYTFEVKAVKAGDANDNGQVTVADVQDIVNYVAEKKNTSDQPVATVFDFPNADADNDGEVNGDDVTAAINIVLGRTNAINLAQRKMRTETNDLLEADNFKVKNMDPFAIGVKLDNNYSYVGLQALLTLPEGMELVEITKGERAAKHQLTYNVRYDGKVIILLYSMGNEAFAEGDGALFNLVVKGREDCRDIRLSQIKASDRNANSYSLSFAGGENRTETTGIEGVEEAGDVRYYTIDGMEVVNPEKGQILIKVANGKTEKVVVK